MQKIGQVLPNILRGGNTNCGAPILAELVRKNQLLAMGLTSPKNHHLDQLYLDLRKALLIPSYFNDDIFFVLGREIILY